MSSPSRDHLEQLQADASGLERRLAVLAEKAAQATRAVATLQKDWTTASATLTQVRADILTQQRVIEAQLPSVAERIARAIVGPRNWLQWWDTLGWSSLGLGLVIPIAFFFAPWLPANELVVTILCGLGLSSVAAVAFGLLVVIIRDLFRPSDVGGD